MVSCPLLQKSKYDESLSVIQHGLSADLESFKQYVLDNQNDKLEPIIKQTTQNYTELVQQRLKLESIINVEAQVSNLYSYLQIILSLIDF